MRGNTHVRFGGAGRGNRTSATTSLRPGPIPTNRTDLDTVEADRFHRNHAIVELAIRELKHGGATHIPSGHYPANAAWFACAVIAHNLTRWCVILGEHDPINNHTMRLRIIAVPAVAVNRSGRPTLRFPTRWPWQQQFTTMLNNMRALPGPAPG